MRIPPAFHLFLLLAFASSCTILNEANDAQDVRAEFTTDIDSILVEGDHVVYTDLSVGEPTEWEWIFEGGDPGISNQQKPGPIRYDYAGEYRTVLRVRNESSESFYEQGIGISTPKIETGFYIPDTCSLTVGSELCFVSTSSGNPEYYGWNFGGDEYYPGGVVGPDTVVCGVVYLTPGDYVISHWAYDDYHNSEIRDTITIEWSVKECPTYLLDYEKNYYDVVRIGNNCWMQENLRASTYSNGKSIKDQWIAGDSRGNWMSINDTELNDETFGKFYNYYAVKEPQNICPVGWHPATRADYSEMWKYLEAEYGVRYSDAGGAMKSVDYEYWGAENVGATNISGYTAIPAGAYQEGRVQYHAVFWMYDERPADEYSQFFNLYVSDDAIRYDFSGAPQFGYSVRCVMDRE